MSPPELVRLGDVATITRKSIAPERISDGTTYVGLENIESGGALSNVMSVSRGDLASAKFEFTADQVLFGKLRPYLAKIARPAFSGVCSTDILPITPGPRLDKNYLSHFLLAPQVVARAASRATGANLPRLSPGELAKFEIPLPPLEDQRRIAAILDQADALRAKRRQALARLDDLTQSIFLDMFGDPVSSSHPWPRRRIGDVALVQIGPFGSLLHREDYVDDGVPLINPIHIVKGQVVPNRKQSVSEGKHSELKTYHLRAGDVIMGRRGEMGRCAIVGAEHDGLLCGTGSLIIRPDATKIGAVYLAAALSHSSMKRHFEGISLGSTLPNLNRTIVANVSVAIPPIEAQTAFEGRLGQVSRLDGSHHAQRAELDALFESLQSRAFAGEL